MTPMAWFVLCSLLIGVFITGWALGHAFTLWSYYRRPRPTGEVYEPKHPGDAPF